MKSKQMDYNSFYRKLSFICNFFWLSVEKRNYPESESWKQPHVSWLREDYDSNILYQHKASLYLDFLKHYHILCYFKL